MNEPVKSILSTKSQSFLENLRIYLFSSGKSSVEIEEIVEELTAHLVEAEENGKPIEKIIGTSPKEYMEMISKEMVFDYSWIKYFFLIIFGSFSITIFTDLLEGNLSYSSLEIIGHIVIGIIFITSILTSFKYLSTAIPSVKKQVLIFWVIGIVPITLFIGLTYLNKVFPTPILHFGNTGSLIIGVITALILISMSLWAKSSVLIVIVALLTLPKYLLSLTTLSYGTQLALQTFISFGGIAIYLWVLNKTEKE